MSRPELKFELDEYGRIVYRVTDEGVLLSKDEKEFIIDHVTRMQAENAKLRELCKDMLACIEALCSMVENSPGCSMCLTNQDEEKPCAAADVYCRMRELGVEVDE